MSFLDDLISDDRFTENVDPGLITYIEQLIWNSSVDERQKVRLTNKLKRLQSNDDAMKMVTELKTSQAIIGLERIPITQYEIVEATRLRVERDDFYDRTKKSNT